jgi:amidohydrolase
MRSCGSDDFAFYRQVAPSLMMFLGVRDGGRVPPALHHPAFLPREDTVESAARAMLAAFAAAAELALGAS